ncbi:MAG: hypothetical protein ACKO15_01765, partial [Burkholderiales bacterium]
MKKGVWVVLALPAVLGIAAVSFWLGGQSQVSNTGGTQAGSAQSAAALKAPANAAPPISVDAARVKQITLAKVIATVGSLRS